MFLLQRKTFAIIRSTKSLKRLILRIRLFIFSCLIINVLQNARKKTNYVKKLAFFICLDTISVEIFWIYKSLFRDKTFYLLTDLCIS